MGVWGVLSKVLDQNGGERGKMGANGGSWRQWGLGGVLSKVLGKKGAQMGVGGCTK